MCHSAIFPGRRLALVGESGCGNPVTSLSISAVFDPERRANGFLAGQVLSFWKVAILLKSPCPSG